MQYTLRGNTPANINLAPETVVEEVMQNIVMILTTPQFSVPLDRGFGISGRFIDKPVQVARAMLIADTIEAIEKYEPRAEVVSVTVDDDAMSGKLIPIVEVIINAGL